MSTPPSCPEAESWLALRSGALSEPLRSELRQHLASCAVCLARYGELLASPTPTQDVEHTLRADPPLEPPVRQLGRYLLLEVLGAGAMGTVYAAYDPKLNRRVAVKLLPRPFFAVSPDSRERQQQRLLREAQAMALLSHPAVVPVFDVGTALGQVFLVMELVRGETLAAWQRRPHSWREVLSKYLTAGRGLAAAHAAGIVHRDFKPENVLVGEDGRVQVTDFGVARVSDSHTDSEPVPEAASLPAELTRTGTVVGTPAYMAPEQLHGNATPLTDQFSFCVALYEALYRRRPFSGVSVEELHSAISAGAVVPLADDPRIPAWLRRAVLRGLRAAPAERYPSMGALLAELSRDPGARWRRGLVGVALVVIPLAAALLVARQPEPCQGAQDKLAGVWDAERKEAIRQRFAATKVAYAADAFRGVERALDAWSASYAAMYAEACEATRVRGEQSEELLDLRMRCLEEQRGALAAQTRLFAEADRAVVEQAVMAAQRLPSLVPCADARSLKAQMRPPDEAARERVALERRRIDEARALLLVGGTPRALPLARMSVQSARAIGYRPLEAEAHLLEGTVLLESAKPREAEAPLHEALQAALASHHDRLLARAWIALVRATSEGKGRYPEAERVAALAGASLERLGGDARLEAERQLALAHVLADEQRYAESLAGYQRAVALFERDVGLEHIDTANAVVGAGVALRHLGRIDQALAMQERGLAIFEKILGPKHPRVAHVHNNIANTLLDASRYDEALVHERRSLAILEEALEPDHPRVGLAMNNLGASLICFARFDEARRLLERALAIRAGALGEKHPVVSGVHINLGVLLLEQGRCAEAMPRFEHVAAVESARGAETRSLARALQYQGVCLSAAGRHEEALTHLRRALAIRERKKILLSEVLRFLGDAYLKMGRVGEARASFTRALASAKERVGAQNPEVADCLAGLGEVELRLGDFRRARELLDEALAMRKSRIYHPIERALNEYALARALLAPGGDPQRAWALARAARAVFARVPARFAVELRELEGQRFRGSRE